jgi:hypothetical protein
MTRNYGRRSRQILAISFSMLLLASCAGGSTARSDSPWATEIEAAQKRAASDFEKEALSDGVVSASEKDEANQRWVTCMTDRGHKAMMELDDFGQEVYATEAANEDSEQSDIDNTLCSEGTIKILPGLYKAMQQNPSNRDVNELYAECLVRHKLVDPPFTGKEFTEAMANSASGTPWNAEDPAFPRCLSFPDQ